MNDSPFRIAVLGAFGAGDSRAPHAARRPRRVDRDNLDAALAAIAPSLALSLDDGGEPVRVDPRAMDDFHPDRLVDSVSAFRELAQARTRVTSGSTFERTVARIRAEADVRRSTARGDDGAETLGLLERIVNAAGTAPGAAPSASRAGDPELEQLIRRIVTPHLVAEPDARELSWTEEIDRAMTTTMRALFQHEDFRALESAWRTAELLVRRLELDASLQLHLLDVDRDELVHDLEAHEPDAASSSAARQLTHVAEGGWSLVVWLDALGDGDDDARLAGRLAALGRALGAPVVAGARPSLVGAVTFAGDLDTDGWRPEISPSWDAAQRGPDASWLGLVAPRLLLRVPYGASGEPCERLAFEEIVGDGSVEAHEQYRWGTGAAAVALLLGEALAEHGTAMRPGHDISGLPMHVRRIDGEAQLVSCAEGIMYERGAEWLLDRGIMPLAWMRDTDTVRLVRVQSIAHEPTPLSGRWGDAR